MKNYSAVILPLTNLVRKKEFRWSESEDCAFTKVKHLLTNAPLLRHPSSTNPFILTRDASKYAVGATLEQEGHPVAYLSYRLTDTETRWDTGDQELLAVMIALRKWAVYLRDRPFILRTDHEPIKYLQSKTKLTGRQMRWIDELQSYNFTVEHLSGSKNGAPDALSRIVDSPVMLKALRLKDMTLVRRIQNRFAKDKWSTELIAWLCDKEGPHLQKIRMYGGNYELDDNKLYWTVGESKRLFVPKTGGLRKEAIADVHQCPHFGVEKTFFQCAKSFYSRGMYKDVPQYVASCHECQQNKEERRRRKGMLQPHEIPSRCWDVLTMDFLTEFPTSEKGSDSVFVIVEKLSKRGIFISTNKETTSSAVVQLLFDHVFSKHGMPTKIILDRDSLFTAKYFHGVTDILNIKRNMATTGHPQTDGQSENTIRTLSQMLLQIIQKNPKDWDLYLSELEFEYNSTRHKSTELTPFEVDLGFLPRSQLMVETGTGSKCNAAINTLERRKMFQAMARDNLAISQAQQVHYANQKRRNVSFVVGNLVMLELAGTGLHSRSDLPNKWRPKFVGPLAVTEILGPVTYRIELPLTMKRAHNVFHVSKLKK